MPVTAFQLASVEGISAIEAVVLVLMSLMLYRLGRIKDRTIKRRRRSRELSMRIDGERYRNRTARPRSTTIARLSSARRFPAA